MITWTDAERDQVLTILRAYTPANARVFAFGSRVAGRVKPYSDLDLVIDSGEALPMADYINLKEAFTESDLPWKVDILDWHTLGAAFRAAIIDKMTPVDLGG